MRYRNLLAYLFLSLLLVPILAGADENTSVVGVRTPPAAIQQSESIIVIERTPDGSHSGRMRYEVYWKEERVGDSVVTFIPFLGDHKIDDYYLLLNLDTASGQATGEFWATASLDPDHEGESGTAAFSGTLSDGWVHYNAEIDAWEYGGTFDTRITASIHAWKGSYGGQDYWEDLMLDVTIPAEFRGGEFNSPNSSFYVGYESDELSGGSHETNYFSFYLSSLGIIEEFEPLRQGAAGSEHADEATVEAAEGSTASEPSATAEPEESEGGGEISDELLLALILAFTKPEHIDQIEGWDQLTPTQQEGILTLFGILAEVNQNTNQAYAEEPAVGDSDELTPYQQSLYDQHRLQQLMDQKNRAELANFLEDKAASWNRIEQVVNEERIRVWGGEHGDTLKDVYQFVQGASLVKGAIDKVGEWTGWVTNTDQAVDKATDKILSEPFSSSTTMEQVAEQGLKLMSQMANVPTVIHFGYYQQQYQKYSEELSTEAAHDRAMEDLRNMILDPTEEFRIADGTRVVRGVWDVRFEQNAESGGLYDKAFFDLRNITPPGVSK